MSYVVSWWERELRRSRSFTTQESAEVKKAQLKARSAALIYASLEPIRLIPQPVFKKMEQLARDSNGNFTCKHKCLQRLCEPCVAGML